MKRFSITIITIGQLVAFAFVLFGCGSEEAKLQEKTDAFLKAGDYDGALKLIDNFIQEHPEKPIGRAMRVKVFTASGQTAQALKEYQRFHALGGIHSHDLLVQILKVAFKDEDDNARELVLGFLEKMDLKKALPVLIETLKDEDSNVRCYTTRVFSDIALKLEDTTIMQPAVEPLIEALQDEDFFVRESAVLVLGEIGDKRAIPALEKVAKEDSHTSIRNVAELILDNLRKGQRFQISDAPVLTEP